MWDRFDHDEAQRHHFIFRDKVLRVKFSDSKDFEKFASEHNVSSSYVLV